MDHPASEEFNELLKGYLRESLNPQELNRFFELAADPENSEFIAASFRRNAETGVSDLSTVAGKQEAWKKLYSKIERSHRSVLPMRTALRWVAILVCLLGAAVAVYTFNQNKIRSDIARSKSAVKTPAWLKANHIGATLILTTGDSVELKNGNNGIVATQNEIQIIQSGGSISYSGKSQKSMFNEIKTGPAKIWIVILPDQTVVWLNDNSSIKYPLEFSSGSRSVELTGEAYFEVTHHADHPFRVRANGYLVEDIGTAFNIRSYSGDTASAATLVEGAVKVKLNDQEATLSPGQQVLITSAKNELHIVKNANVAQALAWKNGFFYFQNAGLTEVMKQLSDWYQVGVVYKGTKGKQLFSGQIDKTLSLTDVLQGIQQPGVKFTLDSSQITVIQQ